MFSHLRDLISVSLSHQVQKPELIDITFSVYLAVEALQAVAVLTI
jgi:hypothetical protein